MIAVSAVLLVQFPYEMTTTGTADMDAVTPTRRRIPIWQIYLIGWICFGFSLWITRPALRYFWNREVFRLGLQGITIRGTTIALEGALGIRRSRVHGSVLCSARGNSPSCRTWSREGPKRLLRPCRT